MSWHSPLYFLFIAVLVLIGLWSWRQRRYRTGAFPMSTLGVLKGIQPGLRARLRWLPVTLKYLGLVLVIVALARPRKSDERIKRNVEGVDIMMALDISHSMLIEDMKPLNRLESSKKTIEEFVEKRVSDRIGLVVFSGESYTRVPLTLDYPILKEDLGNVETSRNIKMGTAIGVALANAVSRLKESDAKTRVVILLTDGESNTGLIDPKTALKIAKGYNIRIYTIGVGRDGQAQLPIYSKDMFGRTRKRYQPIHSKVNVELLQELAKETGGKFYRATTTNALEGVFSEIDQLEKSKIEESKYTQFSELFYNYLLLGFFLYFLSALLNVTIFRQGV